MAFYKVNKGCAPHVVPQYEKTKDGNYVKYSRDEETGNLVKDDEGTEKKKLSSLQIEAGEVFESDVDLEDWDPIKFSYVKGDRSKDKVIPKGPAVGTKGYDPRQRAADAKERAKNLEKLANRKEGLDDPAKRKKVNEDDEEQEEGLDDEDSGGENDIDEEDDILTEATLHSMKLPELRELARSRQIDLGSHTLKDDVIADILADQKKRG